MPTIVTAPAPETVHHSGGPLKGSVLDEAGGGQHMQQTEQHIRVDVLESECSTRMAASSRQDNATGSAYAVESGNEEEIDTERQRLLSGHAAGQAPSHSIAHGHS